MKKTLVALAALLTFFAGNAFGYSFTIEDTWISFKGYEHTEADFPLDEYGSPAIINMVVTVNSETNLLESVTVNLREGSERLRFDSLWINTTYNDDPWDSWDYYVIERHPVNPQEARADGPLAESGLYAVGDGWEYNLSTEGRIGNPNSLADNGSLSILDDTFKPIFYEDTFKLVYNFEGHAIDASGGLFLAYTAWCSNDIIGGSKVPEPGTLLLFGAGILGLGVYRRMRS